MKFSIILLFLFSFNISANSPFSETTISGIIVHDWGTDILINLSDTVSNSEGCDYNQSLGYLKIIPHLMKCIQPYSQLFMLEQLFMVGSTSAIVVLKDHI